MRGKVDFLGIGAQKSATTWLDENLRKHPEIWMPPVKELHYFDRMPETVSGNRIKNRSFINTYKKKLKKRSSRKPILKRALKTIMKDPFTIYWLYKYFYKKPDDKWYLSLFNEGKTSIKGEITPEYSMLGKEKVKHIKKLLPETKIIFLLRNPVDRCWSQIRFYWRDGSFDFKDLKSIKQFIDSPQQQSRSNYLRIIKLWESVFGKDQFFIGFHDDVKKNPEKLYKDVTGFIGADQNFVPGDLKRKIHVSKEHPMPPEIKHYLAEQYHPRLKQLSKMLGGHTETWLKDCERILIGS